MQHCAGRGNTRSRLVWVVSARTRIVRCAGSRGSRSQSHGGAKARSGLSPTVWYCDESNIVFFDQSKHSFASHLE